MSLGQEQMALLLTVSEGAAGLEGMARHVLRAGADGLVVLYMAVGSGAASTDARV